MPTGWRKASLGGLSRLLVSSLRSQAKQGVGDSPLVVQAGFPTSVADLVVKNRSRLRKPSRWRRRGRAEDAAGGSTMAGLASEIVLAVSDQVPTLPSVSPPVPKLDDSKDSNGSEVTKNGVHRSFPASKAEIDESFQASTQSKVEKDVILQGSPQSKVEKDALLQDPESSTMLESRKSEPRGAPSVQNEVEKKVLERGNSGQSMAAATVVFLVIILAIVSKKIAVAVSILAFAALFAESIGRSLIPLLRACEGAKKNLKAISGAAPVSGLIQAPDESGSHRNRRIPIPFLSPGIGEPDLCRFRSEGNWAAEEVPVNATPPIAEVIAPALVEKDPVDTDVLPGDQKKKKKGLFRKFVAAKFGAAKGGKVGELEGNPEPASVFSRGDAPGQNAIGEESLEEEKDDGRGVTDEQRDGTEVLGLQIPGMARGVGLKDAAFVTEKVGKPAKGSSGHLVFFLLVLSGLVGGRVVALLVTVLWYSVVPPAGSLWRRWNPKRALKAVSGAST